MKKNFKDFQSVNLTLHAGGINVPKFLAEQVRGLRTLRVITLRVITHTLPSNTGDIAELLRTFPLLKIKIIAHEKAKEDAERLQVRFSRLTLKLHPDVHSKAMLIKPDILIVGSANLASSGGMDETCVLMRSKEAHDWYVEHEWDVLWRASTVVKQPKSEGFSALAKKVPGATDGPSPPERRRRR